MVVLLDSVDFCSQSYQPIMFTSTATSKKSLAITDNAKMKPFKMFYLFLKIEPLIVH